MITDFSTLTALSIPEGNVVKIEDAAGNVIWAAQSASVGTAILQVEKFTSDTYAAETTYTGEEFILLDIYPKTNGTVSVTYGGLTKTITDTSGAAEPNAQQVYFGTFNGVSDEVETPASGELTIEGDFYAFGCGTYSKTKVVGSGHCSCITGVTDFGTMTEYIPPYAFYNCEKLTLAGLPDSIVTIEDYAFYRCMALSLTKLPSSLVSIGSTAFYLCKAMTLSELPSGLTSIERDAFDCCYLITVSSLPLGITVVPSGAFNSCYKITEMTFHKDVTEINGFNLYSSAQSTASTTTFEFLGTTPPTLGSENSLQANTYTIVVPKGYGDVYKTADDIWATKASKIVEAS